MKPRHFNHVVGVDLGGGKGKKTALATLRVDAAGATVVEIAPREGERPFYDTTLIDTIRQFGDGTLLCLDAPLTLPPCLRCTVPVCPGQEGCVDPAVVAMRAIVAEAAEADPELGGGRNGRRGKPSVTPYTQRATEVYLAHRLRPRAARGARPGHGPARGARRAPGARAGRPLHAQRDAARGLSEGDARGARASRAPTRSTSTSARRARTSSRRSRTICASAPACGASSACRATTCSRP